MAFLELFRSLLILQLLAGAVCLWFYLRRFARREGLSMLAALNPVLVSKRRFERGQYIADEIIKRFTSINELGIERVVFKSHASGFSCNFTTRFKAHLKSGRTVVSPYMLESVKIRDLFSTVFMFTDDGLKVSIRGEVEAKGEFSRQSVLEHVCRIMSEVVYYVQRDKSDQSSKATNLKSWREYG